MAGTPVFWITGNIGGQTANAVVYSEGLEGGTGGAPGDAESQRQYTFENAGTLSNLYFNIGANTCTTNSTGIVRINSVNGQGTLTVTSSTIAGELTDTVHVDSVVVGSLYAIQITGPNSGSWSGLVMAQIFTPTANTTLIVGCSDGPNNGYVSGTTYFNPLIGQNGNPGDSTEAHTQLQCMVAYTLSNLLVNCDTYTGGASVTVETRINGNNGNQSVSPTSINNFIDTVHTDLIPAGGLINYSSVFTSGSYGTGFVAVDFTNITLNTIYVSATPTTTGITFASGGTYYLPFGTRMRSSATESNAATTTNTTFTASDLQIYSAINGLTASSTFKFRINSSNGNQSISIGNGSLGWIQDSVNTDNITATTKINGMLTTGASGTTIAPTNFSFLATYPTSGFNLVFAILMGKPHGLLMGPAHILA